MPDFRIICDSSCDLLTELTNQYDIKVIPYYISLDKIVYLKEGIEINTTEFYRKLKESNVFPKTSLPNLQDYCDAFADAAKNGLDVMCICLTSKFSGSYQSAHNAREIIKEEYPNCNVVVIDSVQVTAVQGLLAIEAAKCRTLGYSIEETAAYINQAKQNSKLYFTVDSLEYLEKGGRIGKAASIAGNILNLKPIIYMSDGELVPYTNIRGRLKAINYVAELAYNDVAGHIDDYIFTFFHGDCLDDLLILKNIMMEKYNISSDLPILTVGVTIGAHIGPTALGIGYVRKNRSRF